MENLEGKSREELNEKFAASWDLLTRCLCEICLISLARRDPRQETRKWQRKLVSLTADRPFNAFCELDHLIVQTLKALDSYFSTFKASQKDEEIQRQQERFKLWVGSPEQPNV